MDSQAQIYLPIAQLIPSIDTSTRSIRGVVTIIWPYSSSKQTTSILLVDPDFRLRQRKGQVRITFRGSSARAIARSGLSSGDQLALRLEGATWTDNGLQPGTPGRAVDWELVYSRRVILEILRANDPPFLIDIDRSSPSPEPAPGLPLTPFSTDPAPEPKTIFQAPRESGYWDSPAFLKRKSLPPAAFFTDRELEDDDWEEGRFRKRTRFGRANDQWRFVERTPSPEVDTVVSESVYLEEVLEKARQGEIREDAMNETDRMARGNTEGTAAEVYAEVYEVPQGTPRQTELVAANIVKDYQRDGIEEHKTMRQNAEADGKKGTDVVVQEYEEGMLPGEEENKTPFKARDGSPERFSPALLQNCSSPSPIGFEPDEESLAQADIIPGKNACEENNRDPTEQKATELLPGKLTSGASGPPTLLSIGVPETPASGEARFFLAGSLVESSNTETFADDSHKDEGKFVSQFIDLEPSAHLEVSSVPKVDYPALSGLSGSSNVPTEAPPFNGQHLPVESVAIISDAGGGDLLEGLPSPSKDRGDDTGEEDLNVQENAFMDDQAEDVFPPDLTPIEVIDLGSSDDSGISDDNDSAAGAELANITREEGAIGHDLDIRKPREIDEDEDIQNHLSALSSSPDEEASDREELNEIEEIQGQERRYVEDVNPDKGETEEINELPGGDILAGATLNSEKTNEKYPQEHGLQELETSAKADSLSLSEQEMSPKGNQIPSLLQQEFDRSTRLTRFPLSPDPSGVQNLSQDTFDTSPRNDIPEGEEESDSSEGGRQLETPLATQLRNDSFEKVQEPYLDEGIIVDLVPTSSQHTEIVDSGSSGNPQKSFEEKSTKHTSTLDFQTEAESNVHTEPTVNESLPGETSHTTKVRREMQLEGFAANDIKTEDPRIEKIKKDDSPAVRPELGKTESSNEPKVDKLQDEKPEDAEREATMLQPQKPQLTTNSPLVQPTRITRSKAHQVDGVLDPTSSTTSTKDLFLSSGFRTPLAYFSSLPSLSSKFATLVDTLAIVISSTSPSRTVKGPRHFSQTLVLTDPPSIVTPQGFTLAQIFRPAQSALPLVRQGDVILLRDFKVQSYNRKVSLISTDSSGWAVFKKDREPQVRGPPIEMGEEERQLAKRFSDWWGGLEAPTKNHLTGNGAKEVEEIEKASENERGEGRRRSERRGSEKRQSLGVVGTRHLLRDGTSYTDGDVYDDHELRDGTVYSTG